MVSSASIDEAISAGEARFTVSPEGRSWRGSVDMGVALSVLLIAWYVLAFGVEAVRGVGFPTPGDVIVSLVALLSGDEFYGSTIYRHTLMSLSRWVVGYLLAVTVGSVIGIAMGLSDRFGSIAINDVFVIQLIPGLAWIPVVLLTFGIGEAATVAIIFLTALAPVVLSTSNGLKGLPREYIDVADVMGIHGWRRLWTVLLPGASLSILTGLRLALGNAWRVLIAAEMVVGVAVGLGFCIYESQWTLGFSDAFACIAIICVIGLIVERLVFSRIETSVRDRLGVGD